MIKMVYGAELSRRTLAMLAFGSALYMVGLAMAQAVIALRGHVVGGPRVVRRRGGVAALYTALGGHDLFQRVEIGLVASSAAALLGLRGGARGTS